MTSWRVDAAAVAAAIVFSTTCFGQAAAEGALTHALSSSMGSSIGTSLGRATNQLSGKMGQQLSNVAPGPRGTSTKKNQPRSLHPTTAAVPAAPGAPLIASIQGGETRDSTCLVSPATTDDHSSPAASTEPAHTKDGQAARRSHIGCESSAKDPDDHPSVVNLPPAK